MSGERRTFRYSDGERVPGLWRPVFAHHGGVHSLTELTVYADGLVDCWGLSTVEEFAERVGYGQVAARIAEGSRGSAAGLATWRFASAHTFLTPERLMAEIRADIERLNAPPERTGPPADRAVLVDEFSLPELHNDHPMPVTVDEVRHSCAAEAFQALDGPGGAQARPAVMARVLRAKFAQHPGAAEILLATGDTTIRYHDPGSTYWGEQTRSGRNWMGRLLELVRAELALADQAH
ncbi:NADAR family protein [Kitasatospora sp. NBC_00240]|uniref:NADAR family protein n=1 Tax=Kitasatospora sp. NBC_00240 TaxID=2903567 RepID=UPI00225746C1|nr:NADAR family protein [Kitasatospora sp. NBC_00240]MCX5208568.1 NADAR family protein [Kitasatospora sp. NBC_00240]